MIVHQTSRKNHSWGSKKKRKKRKPSLDVLCFSILKSPQNSFDWGRHVKPGREKKRKGIFSIIGFQWTLEDLRVHYNEAPNVYWCDRRCATPTAAPTLDTSLRTGREACHDCRMGKKSETLVKRLAPKFGLGYCSHHAYARTQCVNIIRNVVTVKKNKLYLISKENWRQWGPLNDLLNTLAMHTGAMCPHSP